MCGLGATTQEILDLIAPKLLTLLLNFLTPIVAFLALWLANKHQLSANNHRLIKNEKWTGEVIKQEEIHHHHQVGGCICSSQNIRKQCLENTGMQYKAISLFYGKGLSDVEDKWSTAVDYWYGTESNVLITEQLTGANWEISLKKLLPLKYVYLLNHEINETSALNLFSFGNKNVRFSSISIVERCRPFVFHIRQAFSIGQTLPKIWPNFWAEILFHFLVKIKLYPLLFS